MPRFPGSCEVGRELFGVLLRAHGPRVHLRRADKKSRPSPARRESRLFIRDLGVLPPAESYLPVIMITGYITLEGFELWGRPLACPRSWATTAWRSCGPAPSLSRAQSLMRILPCVV